ncbi:MAG: RNA polymerase sigma factor [Patescibacteria group bacterium]
MKIDSDLVKEYLGGDQAAMNELVNRHIKSIYGFVYRLTGLRNEAPDIVQEVFIKIWKNLKRYDPKQSFKAWMMTIARNTSIDWMRKRRALSFSDLSNDAEGEYFEDTLADSTPLAEELFEKEETKNLIEKEIEKLPIPSREVVLLRHSEDLSFEEIAGAIGKPLNTVKSQYRRALIRMKESMHQNKH